MAAWIGLPESGVQESERHEIKCPTFPENECHAEADEDEEGYQNSWLAALAGKVFE